MIDYTEVGYKLDSVKETLDEIWDDLPQWLQKFYQVDINNLQKSVKRSKKKYGKN